MVESAAPTIYGIDLFCGIGGLTRGLLDAGIQVRRGVDNNGRLKVWYEYNNPPAKFLKGDVTEVSGEELVRGIPRGPESKILLAGCAPCQQYSGLNKRPKKAYLLSHFGRLVEEIEPDIVLMENVPGLKGLRGGLSWKRLVNRLARFGYLFREPRVLDAKDFGVPQTRRRLILLAGKGFEVPFPEPTHGPKGTLLKPFRTVRDAIEKYPRIAAGEAHPEVPNHKAKALLPINLQRIRSVPHDGGSRSSFPEQYVLDCHKKYDGHTDTYGRMKWDSPSPTLTCKCVSITNGRFGHPEQDRAITPREAASLQSFGDSFLFPPEPNIAGRWIGNAVPPLLAQRIGEAIRRAVEERGRVLTVRPTVLYGRAFRASKSWPP